MNKPQEGSWQKELDDIAHGMSGAFLFGVPLLFTMEMWWIGNFTEPLRLLVIVALAFGANLMLAAFAGFKEERSFFANVLQSVEALAIGVVASAVVLVVLNQIGIGDSLHSLLGRITVQVLPLSLGASAANVLLSRGSDKMDEDEESAGNSNHWKAALLDLARTVGGALFIGFSIAPTEEVPMLAAQLSPGQELALIALSLAITYLIVFVSGFSPREQDESHGPFQSPISETASSYIVSLLVAFGSLIIFSQVDLSEPLPSIVAKTLVLGLPAAIGGAAARVLI
ncbi:MAG: TIGR02587 family membrane protein [Chloroflexota bacterium]|nr:TIGR02587 family membrane protein [Chloroflexota bacterium]